MEIEKKYLLNAMPAGLTNGTAIVQGYIATGDPEIRIRSKAGRSFFLTVKGGEGFVRSEVEVSISEQAFEDLWSATENKRVIKTRYELTAPDGLIWEIDEYHGSLTGLFSAEVELPDEQTAPIMPEAVEAVLVADVATDKNYKNKKLATDGLPSTKVTTFRRPTKAELDEVVHP
jgi:adenylate cyclase